MASCDDLVLQKSIARAADVDALSPHDRSLLAGWLAQSTHATTSSSHAPAGA
jgi:hypothetical protein